ncbi:hypothetical protein BD413DRAFT_8585 [Trametes elegans]|nr:hypothetical protein BD413DRAFT_8585 [Trametes elegans]
MRSKCESRQLPMSRGLPHYACERSICISMTVQSSSKDLSCSPAGISIRCPFGDPFGWVVGLHIHGLIPRPSAYRHSCVKPRASRTVVPALC